MAITMDQIKQLREETGAGIMDVRKALTASDGNMEAAKKWRKQSGRPRQVMSLPMFTLMVESARS